MTTAHVRGFALWLVAGVLRAGLAMAASPEPRAHPMIRVAFTLHFGVEPAAYHESLAEPGVPFTLGDGDGAGRWRIVATARQRKDGTFQLDATLSCGGRIARRAHVRTAGRENMAMIAAQSAACPEARREITADIRMHGMQGEEAGEEITPSWQMFYKVCWDARGTPTTIDFLRSKPEGFAGTAVSIAESMRTWTFGNEDKRLGQPPRALGPRCETVAIDVN